MENTKNISKLPTAPGTKKTYYYDEILTAYNIAVDNAVKDGALEDDSLGAVCEELWDDSGEEQTLNKMRLGFLPPSPKLLSFIKDFAGEKYNYTFLASEPDHHGAITKIKLTADGNLCLQGGKPFSVAAADMNDEFMCALFLNFVSKKHDGEIDDAMLFYDYLQTEPQKRREQDPIFYDYSQDLKAVVLQNILMLDAVAELDWYLTRVISEVGDIGTAIWNLVDQLVPNLAEQSTKCENAQSLIRVRDRVNVPVNLTRAEASLCDYHIEFLLTIPRLTTDMWNILIKLVALHDLNPTLYTEVANLILQAFKIRQQSFDF